MYCGSTPRRLGALATIAALVASASACATESDDTVLVLAAASLTDVFGELEAEFEAAHPDIDVDVSFAGSTTVRVQVEQGAPADVVAFADIATMEELVKEGLVDTDEVAVFAANRLVLVTPIDDPGSIAGLDDLADGERTVGVCVPTVPCGVLAEKALRDAGVSASIDTEEPDVRSLVAKLVSGELDAGLVYATDAAAFVDDLRVVVELDATNRYPIAVLADADGDAALFVEFVRSDIAAAVLAEAGFDAP